MPRFVLLRHELPEPANKPSHWDLMLEREADSLTDPNSEHRLATWNLFNLPTEWLSLLSLTEITGVPFPLEAEQLADHRAHYLDHEGPVSDNRGVVQRIAEGNFEWIEATPTRYEAKLLSPSTLVGRLILERSKHTSTDKSNWLLNWYSQGE